MQRQPHTADAMEEVTSTWAHSTCVSWIAVNRGVKDVRAPPSEAGAHPGRSSRKVTAMLMSARYRIWVRWRSTRVHRSGVGASSSTHPPPDPVTRLPNGRPIQS